MCDGFSVVCMPMPTNRTTMHTHQNTILCMLRVVYVVRCRIMKFSPRMMDVDDQRDEAEWTGLGAAGMDGVADYGMRQGGVKRIRGEGSGFGSLGAGWKKSGRVVERRR